MPTAKSLLRIWKWQKQPNRNWVNGYPAFLEKESVSGTDFTSMESAHQSGTRS